MGPESFLERLSSIVHLSEKQRAQIENAYFESIETLRVESHCAKEIKLKDGGKKACGRELMDGKCPIHKLNVQAPAPAAEKKMCSFPSAKDCTRRAVDGSPFCSFHKDKTPEEKKTLSCKFVFQAGEHKGETCGAKFCDYSKYQAPGQLPELKRPDNYKDMTKAEQLEWEENTSDLVRDFFAEISVSPEQYLGEYMNQYCPTHYIDAITKEIKKESSNIKYDAKAKIFVEKSKAKSKSKKSEKSDSDDEEKPKKKSKKNKSDDSDEEKPKKKEAESDSDDEKPKKKSKKNKSDDEKKSKKKNEESDSDSDDEKPKKSKKSKKKSDSDEKPKKPMILDDDNSDDESDDDNKDAAVVYPELNFKFPEKWSEPAYVGAKIDGQSAYLRPTWRDDKGQTFRSPFLVEKSKINEDIAEILGYTTVLDRNQLASSEFKREYHPMMDEFIALMKKHDPSTKVYITEHIQDKI